jgi:hypothetical protein
LAFYSGREADHSPPSSAGSKNGWSCTSTPPIRLHDVVLRESTGTTLPFTFYVLQFGNHVSYSKSKALLSLCLTKHHTMKYCGSGGIAPCILNPGIRWKWVVSFMPRLMVKTGEWFTFEVCRYN